MLRKISPILSALAGALIATPTLAANKIESQSGLGSLQSVAREIFSILIVFLPVIATIFLAISGYRYMVAQGNPELVEKAKKSLTYAVFGAIVAYISVAIIVLVGKIFHFNTTI